MVALDCPRNKFLETLLHTFQGIFALRRQGCDVAHIHAVGPGFFVPLARILGLKVVMTNHGPDYERKKWGKAARIFLRSGELFATLGANAVISVSLTIAANLFKKYRKTATFIPNGVHVPVPAQTREALDQFQLTSGRYILAVGRFVPEKGFHDLIDAFAALENHHGWKLALVGDADHADSYSRTLKEKAGRCPDVVLPGFQKGRALAELFSHAGVFVLPSYHEGLPIVLLEAMSYGLSCLVSDIPANCEVGLATERHFPVGNIAELKKKLEHFMKSGRLTGAQKEAQLNRIKSGYNWDDIAQSTLQVYRRVLDG